MIPRVFNDFFNSLTIPTLILNNELNIIYTYNYDINIKNTYYTEKAIEYLKNFNFKPSTINIAIRNNIKYTCIMFHHYNNDEMYILMGPYIINKNSQEDNDNSVLQISERWINNMVKLYSHLIDNHISEVKNDKLLSPCVNHAINYIKENFSEDISIDKLCKELNINKCYFCSIFKKETGSTFINYLNSYKVDKSKDLLKDRNMSLLDISLAVGFNNQSYYSTVFKKITSKTPLEYRDEFL